MSVFLHHQTTGKRVKRCTVGQPHFLSCAEGSLGEAGGIPGKDIGYVDQNNHRNSSYEIE